jgi:hypothetical protein
MFSSILSMAFNQTISEFQRRNQRILSNHREELRYEGERALRIIRKRNDKINLRKFKYFIILVLITKMMIMIKHKELPRNNILNYFNIIKINTIENISRNPHKITFYIEIMNFFKKVWEEIPEKQEEKKKIENNKIKEEEFIYEIKDIQSFI